MAGSRPFGPRFRNEDPIAKLYCHYFQPSDDCYNEYSKLKAKEAKLKRPGPDVRTRRLNFMRLWLATLYAVLEGYRELELMDPRIDALLMGDDEISSLRLFRNGTFHFQRTAEKHTQFILSDQATRVIWAEILHKEFYRYFRRYAIDATVAALLAEDAERSSA